MSIASYTREGILRQLDSSPFPGMENLYIYPGDVRLSAYRDEAHWVLLMEMLGVTDHGWCAHGGIHNWITRWGNNIKGRPGDANLICMTYDGPEGPTFEREFGWEFLRKEAKTLKIRDTIVTIDTDPDTLVTKGIPLENPPKVTAPDLLRSLLPDHRNLLLATEDELRRQLPYDLPLVLRLDEWHHPEYYYSPEERNQPHFEANRLPSANETFQMIADVLALDNPALYRPTVKPNTHWTNWYPKRI